MKAMILAAGLGTRLKPITDSIPKALAPVNGRPMLEHLILKLKAADFREIIINIHHFGEQIIDFLAANDNFGIKIKISDERDYLLDTGGGIKHAAKFLAGNNEPFLVHNVDILSNVDLKAFYDHHLETNPLATLLVNKRNTSRYLLFDKDNKLCAWYNRDTGEVKSSFPNFDPQKYTGYAFGGVHVISPQLFEWMEEWTGRFSIINFYLSVCVKTNIWAYSPDGLQLTDIGKPEAIRQNDYTGMP
jgi:NDP-sugar pyrophosphorylase family protein